jgi:hypothetical protein
MCFAAAELDCHTPMRSQLVSVVENSSDRHVCKNCIAYKKI